MLRAELLLKLVFCPSGALTNAANMGGITRTPTPDNRTTAFRTAPAALALVQSRSRNTKM